MCYLAAISYFAWSLYVTYRWRESEKKAKRYLSDLTAAVQLIPKHDAKGRFQKKAK